MIFVGVHVAATMLDTYVSFGPAQTLLPFASGWHPVAVAWGIVALYLLLAVELTSLARSHLPLRIWRRFHYVSFAVFVFSTVHLLTAGTDRTNPAVVLPVIAVCGAVVILTALRIAPQERQPIAPRPAPTPGRTGRVGARPAPAPPRGRREPVAPVPSAPRPSTAR